MERATSLGLEIRCGSVRRESRGEGRCGCNDAREMAAGESLGLATSATAIAVSESGAGEAVLGGRRIGMDKEDAGRKNACGEGESWCRGGEPARKRT